MQNKKQAFTLVELIVVITILAILGTIAFISLQGYSVNSRDSVRISDMSGMETSLELFNLNAGKYPLPTNGTEITYSGSEAWTQGTFGEDTYKNVEKLDKIPKDPLTNKEYTYSTTNTRQEYQIAQILEGDDYVLRPPLTPPYQGEGLATLVLQTQAGEKLAILKITGNYNGEILKVNKGLTTYVLAVPSIITSTGGTLTDIITNKHLAYNGYKNLPFGYNNSSYNTLGDSGITLVNFGNLVVFSGSISDLTNPDDSTARQSLIVNLKNAYSGTTIANKSGIKKLVNINASNAKAVELLASSKINNNLGGKLKIVATTNTPSNKTVADCGTSTGQIIYGTLDGTDVLLTCDQDIIVCNGTTGSGITIASCNAGATIVFTTQTFTTSTGARNTGINSWAGGLYQWGNNAELSTAPISGTQVGATTNDSTYSNNTFITGSTDWTSIQNDNLWGNITNTDLARKGPCVIGYHVPTVTEWQDLTRLKWDAGNANLGTLMLTDLKIPMTGRRTAGIVGWSNQGSFGYYWSSTPRTTRARNMQFSSTNIYATAHNIRNVAFSIRCFKN